MQPPARRIVRVVVEAGAEDPEPAAGLVLDQIDTGRRAVHHYAFRLPDGTFIGRVGLFDPLAPQHPRHALPFSLMGLAVRQKDILSQYPTATIVPCPRWNPLTEDYEVPTHVPPPTIPTIIP